MKKRTAAPAAAQPYQGIEEMSNPIIVVPPAGGVVCVPLPVAAPCVPAPLELMIAFPPCVVAGATLKEMEPEVNSPTLHNSVQFPTVLVSNVPDLEKFPLGSVCPMVVPLNAPCGPVPVTVTSALGIAPVIDTVQVSPTLSAVPPREVVNVN